MVRFDVPKFWNQKINPVINKWIEGGSSKTNLSRNRRSYEFKESYTFSTFCNLTTGQAVYSINTMAQLSFKLCLLSCWLQGSDLPMGWATSRTLLKAERPFRNCSSSVTRTTRQWDLVLETEVLLYHLCSNKLNLAITLEAASTIFYFDKPFLLLPLVVIL